MDEIGLVILGIVVLAFMGMLPLIFGKNAEHDGSNNEGRRVELDDLEDFTLLDEKNFYDVGYWRQSGNLHRTGGTGVSRGEAIREVITTFKRAKVGEVVIQTNDEDELSVWRSVYHGKGTQEGKRLGGATIKRVLWQDEFDEYSNKISSIAENTIAEGKKHAVTFIADTDAKKTIVKAFFRFKEQINDQVPDFDGYDVFGSIFYNKLNPETGEGKLTVHGDYIAKLLCLADMYLSAEVSLTDDIRKSFQSSDVGWQRELGFDASRTHVLGLHAYGAAAPEEVQAAVRSLWEEALPHASSDTRLKAPRILDLSL